MAPLPSDWRRWRVVPERLAYWAERDPERPFLGCGSDVTPASLLSYGEVQRLSDALAGALAALGVMKGDRVAIVLPNRLEYLITFFALARLGAVQVPINPYLKGDFLGYQLADSGTTVLVGDQQAIKRVGEINDQLRDLRTLVCVDDDVDGCPDGTLSFSDLLLTGHVAPSRAVDARDLLAVMYTSGTTGMPKGCMLSHGYYMTLGWPWFERGWIREGDRRITALPLFHIGGQGIAMMPHLLSGDSVVFLEKFSATNFIRQAKVAAATVAFGVGPMAMALLTTKPTEADKDHNLRLASFVPLVASVHDQFEERFGVQVRSENYGQTECNPVTFAPFERPDCKRGSLGMPTSLLDVAIHDDDDIEVGPDTVGEIVLRPRDPHAMFSGYWRNPTATADAWQGLWHHTGDLGRLDQDGYLWFVDRKKDAIRRRGENVSSVEVELAIARHRKIEAVAVHAVPSLLGEDDIKACIVCTPGARFDPGELHEFFRDVLPYFAVPRYVEFFDLLPMGPTNRVRKQELRDLGTANAWDFDELGLIIDPSQRR